MNQHALILTSFLLLSVPMSAESSLPIIEIKADRTMIYPQRMELTGEETLMDVLQMVPELMIAGYEEVIANYNLRIDNCPMNGDTRLILSQMKAKDIAKIQVCDNTGVAKGTIGMGRVLDINMKMPESLKGFAEGQGDFGKNLYTAKSGTYASFRLAPTAYLPQDWQIGMQVVYYTKRSPIRETTGVPVYGCLSVSKQFGRKWYLGVDWHDMFDACCSEANVNRHAANIKLQYRF